MFGKSLPLSGSANNTIKRTRSEDPSTDSVKTDSPPPEPEPGTEEYMEVIEHLVGYAVEKGASDIHLRVGCYPVIRVDGDLAPVEAFSTVTGVDMDALIDTVLNPRERERLEHGRQVDTSVGIAAVGRIRINVFYQRGTPAMAIRVIKTEIPTLEELGLPEVAYKMARLRSGLVLVIGATGAGKSTTLAALVNEINKRYPKHIITIEDPIEFLFRDKRSIISQREIGIDASSFSDAMAAALREDPDVILLSDMRDTASMEFAMNAAETGHLVFGTLHSPTAPDTITRIVSSFPSEAQNTIRTKLSRNLKAVIGQRLLPARDRKGRVLAYEIMVLSPRIQELVQDPARLSDIQELINNANAIDGVTSFDRQIYELYEQGRITSDTAVRYATSPNDMGLRLRGFSS
ncbi:MAG: PilT/PilU family type 4a pilus ATPase [Proteobacteria bacterium]|nr:MAG: PilT/PilU family type 4a pilus ATPase [Pseudomonadota bacterium]